jgi:FG-GAP-like repeat
VKLSGPANQVSVSDINGDGNPDLAISRTTQVLL